jgi:hypothetical protein
MMEYNNRKMDSFIHSSMALHPFVGPSPLLQFRNPIHWTSDQPVAWPLSTYRTTHIHTEKTHALSGIRTPDPSVRASEDSSCPRPRGLCDRHMKTNTVSKFPKNTFRKLGTCNWNATSHSCYYVTGNIIILSSDDVIRFRSLIALLDKTNHYKSTIRLPSSL